MLVDRMEYASEYTALLPHWADALACLRTNPGPGRHDFPGGYLTYQEGETRPASETGFEAHRKYVDVQVLLEGRELILWNRPDGMTEAGPYDAERDKLPLAGRGAYLEMRPGMFCVLFPTDAHTACRHEPGASPGRYAKYVVKLEI